MVAESRRDRAGLLTAWLGAWLQGRAASDDLLDAVQGNDAPHQLDGRPLAQALPPLRRLAPARVHLHLPVPGDPDGLSGPSLSAAMASGEAVLVGPEDPATAGVALVPHVETRGHATDPLTCVTWQSFNYLGRATTGPATPTRLREAEQQLTDAIEMAVATIARTGHVSRITPEAAAAIEQLRARRKSALPLPPGSPGEAARILSGVDRIAAVTALAGQDVPRSSTASEQRERVLRDLRTAVRHARRLAYNACADGRVG